MIESACVSVRENEWKEICARAGYNALVHLMRSQAIMRSARCARAGYNALAQVIMRSGHLMRSRGYNALWALDALARAIMRSGHLMRSRGL